MVDYRVGSEKFEITIVDNNLKGFIKLTLTEEDGPHIKLQYQIELKEGGAIISFFDIKEEESDADRVKLFHIVGIKSSDSWIFPLEEAVIKFDNSPGKLTERGDTFYESIPDEGIENYVLNMVLVGGSRRKRRKVRKKGTKKKARKRRRIKTRRKKKRKSKRRTKRRKN
jgi:hypothetical protein